MSEQSPGQQAMELASLTLALVLLGVTTSPLAVPWLASLLSALLPHSPPWGAAGLAAALASLLAALGAQALARRAWEQPPVAWPAPATLAALGSFALRQAPTRLYWLLGLGGIAAWLALLLWLPALAAEARRGYETLLRAAIYGTGWLAFAAAHTWGPLAVPGTGIAAGLLAVQVLSLQGGETPPWGAGAAMAWLQASIAAGLWLAHPGPWVAGAVHLLLFHAGLSLEEAEGPLPALVGSVVPAATALALLGFALR